MYKGTITVKTILLSMIALQNIIPLRNLETSTYIDRLIPEKSNHKNSFCLFTSYAISLIFHMSFSENDTVEIPFSSPNTLNDFMDILSFCCEIRS